VKDSLLEIVEILVGVVDLICIIRFSLLDLVGVILFLFVLIGLDIIRFLLRELGLMEHKNEVLYSH